MNIHVGGKCALFICSYWPETSCFVWRLLHKEEHLEVASFIYFLLSTSSFLSSPCLSSFFIDIE